ncbi:membralin-like protein At1g60995 isoform X2 [Physcomitrium patens]|nr:hypothetical protein PHYPA_005533 [Physcomitrium patens]
MDPEQTFLRVHARFSGVLARLLTPKVRKGLEFACLFNAMTLLALLVVMHVNFVAQPGCAEYFPTKDLAGAQLVQIKIRGSWNRFREDDLERVVWNQDISAKRYMDDAHGRRNEVEETYQVPVMGELDDEHKQGMQRGKDESVGRDISSRPMSGPGRGPLGTALVHYFTRWSSYGASCFKSAEQSIRSLWQVWRITGWEPFTTTPKSDRRTVAWNKLDSVLENGSRLSDPTYLYSIEKGYLMMTETAKNRHDVKTINISVSAHHPCFGNRWQQFLIDNFVGYDTILMNSLLSAYGRGYLYNFQTKELYNLNYLQEFGSVPQGIEDYIVSKCGVLITTLFVFFTTTMSVSFTLRETQARMLKFTVQLQHHARHRLPTYRLIFIHVVESLVFVPIMIGILFFLFEFFDDQLLAFLVLTLVWLCELFTMISVRTPLSMQFFPRFFFLYFMAFHIYFFSYTYGFSYLAFSATAAFMQHLVLYFWNRFEIPALQLYLRRQAMLQHQGVHITSSAYLTSTVHVSQGTFMNNSGQTMRDMGGLNVRTGSPDNQIGTSPRDQRTPGAVLSPRTPLTSSNVVNDLNAVLDPPLLDVSSFNVGTPSDFGFIPPAMRRWSNSPGQDVDSRYWRRRLDMDRLRRSRERGARFGNTGMEASFGVDVSREPPTSPLMHNSFSAFGSVLPWILGSSSFFLPVFHELGDGRAHSRNGDEVVDTDLNTTPSNSTTPGSVVTHVSDEGLRQRRGANHVDDT